MLKVSKRALKILAAGVWYAGGIMLVRKAVILLVEAESMRPNGAWPMFAVVVGVVVGLVKARFLFNRACRKNLARIDALERQMIWGFFRPWFFFFLALMILTGATLSNKAHGNYPFLIGVAALDLTIATALLASSVVFWKERFLSRR
jgi:hypothetical protein